MSATRLRPLALAVALAAVLSGCTSSAPSPPAPLAEDELLAAYELSLDDRWGWVEDTYPDAVRPEVPRPIEITWSTWDETMGTCMAEVGYDVRNLDGGGFEAEARPGVDLEDLAVGDFYCNAAFPWQGTLDAMLSEDQLDALYTYYVEIVTPCLAMNGRRVLDIPDREQFVYSSYSWVSWHPFYATSAAASFSGEDLIATNAVCPLEPWWYEGIMRGVLPAP